MNNNQSIQKVDPELGNEKILSKSFFIKTLVNGLLLMLPIIIVIFLLSLIFKLVFNLVAPLSAILDQNAESHTVLTNVLALLLLLVFIFIFGLIVRNRKGQLHFTRFERRYLLQIPLYSSIKETIAQFSGIKDMPFSQVVLVDIYDSGVLLTGFVTESLDNEIYTIFVPTAPNPMNGNIYHVPVKQLKFLDIEPEKAMKSIVGMGTGSSQLFKAKTK